MRKCITMVVIFAVMFLSGQLVSAQSMQKKVMTIEDGEVTIIQGIGAVVKGDGKSLVVEFLPPKERLTKEYKDVNLMAKDEIVMFNGKRVTTIEEFDNLMSGIEDGGEVKLGVKRGKDMMIVSFPKGDASSGGMMMMTMDVDDGGEMHSVININGVEYENAAVLDAGLVIVAEKNQLVLAEVLPRFSELVEGKSAKKGDVILTLNNAAETSTAALQKIYNNIPDGDKVTLLLDREGKEITVTFIKKSIMQKKTVIED